MGRKPIKLYQEIDRSASQLYVDLCAPFEVSMVDWRLGSKSSDNSKGMALAYVDARTVMERLDMACGPNGWQDNYTPGVNGSIICNIGIRFPDGEWIWKADGAGATDVEGDKGALSDAFKRAAVRFGVGRYLYEMASPWVAIVPMGKSYRIADEERPKLDALHEKYCESGGWGQRAGIQSYRLLAKVIKEFVTDQATAQEFKEKNAGEIALLPVAMQRNLIERLDRIGAEQQEAA